MKNLRQMENDSDILELLRAGDANGFKEIYNRTFKLISRYVMNNSGQLHDAEDLFQDSLIALLNNVRQPDFTLTSSLVNYLMTIARNLWLKSIKKNKFKHSENLDGISEQWISSDIEISIEETELENERQEQLSKNFDQLNEDCKKLLTEYYYYHKSLDKISKEMNYTYDFVKVKKFRCMKELKKNMQTL